MFSITRRGVLAITSTILSGSWAPSSLATEGSSADSRPKSSQRSSPKAEWMARWMTNAKKAKDVSGDFWLGRFRDEWYFLLKPIAWTPSTSQAGKYEAVHVPAGFVTDLASIPWPLWWHLRPDGQYALAAVIHDYLYWTQKRPRVVADEILKFGMEDLQVPSKTINEIYTAVRWGGQSPWDENAKLRLHGERRVLAQFQSLANVPWGEVKNYLERFAPSDDP